MNLLEMNHIKKSFDGTEVIKDISLSVKEGEVVAVIGPSGSGKSTLLRCATMLETVDSGEITYLGEKAVWMNERKEAVYAKGNELKKIRGFFGLVFQNFNLFPHFSIIKNVTDAPIHVQKRQKEEVMQKGRELLKKMGLTEKESAYPYQLSGGQQQRVSIARALALNPKILFFDEPTSALDPELTGEILKVIKDLAAEKMTMVIVTHEMGFARDVADRIIFMDGGVIVEEGPAVQVINAPKHKRTQAFLSRFEN
jgi:polar amino acid transport system ATP-binding protein